nr:hypothetical protein [Salinisphaera sp. Q1T1-3]
MTGAGRRAIVVVMDSVGIGAAHDAARYDDLGADTFGHIEAAASAARGAPLADGLGANAESGATQAWAAPQGCPRGSTGGHWEIAGAPIMDDWGYFGRAAAAPYPVALLEALVERAALPGLIVVGRASGTTVIAEHGNAHIASGRPIVYTSADSVFQIAAHERHFGIERLYEVCRIARELCDAHRIARVIARPFIGQTPDTFERTARGRDFAMPPPEDTLLDVFERAGVAITTIGKIGDLFARPPVERSRSPRWTRSSMPCTTNWPACRAGRRSSS